MSRFLDRFQLKLVQCTMGQLIRPFCTSFKSDLSLENVYPKSSLKITSPSPLKNGPNFNGYIPLDQLELTYSRASGPGGQNVNTANTKVDLRFKIADVTFISEATKKRILEEHKTKITKDGYFVLRNDVTRSQQLNLADALEKVRNIIRRAESPKMSDPTPETVEKIRRRQEKAARERLQMKRHKSLLKQQRQPENINI